MCSLILQGIMAGVTLKVKLPPDFLANVGALLRTPPPPAGDPSTRKGLKKAAPKKKAAARKRKRP